jgi:hypothetical protein
MNSLICISANAAYEMSKALEYGLDCEAKDNLQIMNDSIKYLWIELSECPHTLGSVITKYTDSFDTNPFYQCTPVEECSNISSTSCLGLTVIEVEPVCSITVTNA